MVIIPFVKYSDREAVEQHPRRIDRNRQLTGDDRAEQWREARSEAESAASEREAALRARHAAARREGHLPDDE